MLNSQVLSIGDQKIANFVDRAQKFEDLVEEELQNRKFRCYDTKKREFCRWYAEKNEILLSIAEQS